MAEPSTIARPYAEAVFRLADAGAGLARWSDTLADLARVGADPQMARVIDAPDLTAPRIAGAFIAVLAGRLDGEAENFVRVLAENGRLDLLPEIARQFEALRHEREGVVEAAIESAFELAPDQLAALVRALEAKTGKRVKPQVSLDPELIAGVRITLGDKVIDGSARAQLAALEAALKH